MIEHPFSLGLSDYQGREDLGERLDALLVAFEFLLRVNALVLGSTFLQNENCRDDKVRGLLTHPIYHLSDWYVLLQSLLAVLPSALFPRLRRWFILMEKQCRKKQVPSLLTKNCTRQAFQNLLAIRNRRAHNERRVQSDFVQDNLALAECCFKYCLAEFPPLGNLYIDGQGRMSYHSEDLDICCEPLLLPGTLVGQPHSVLMYAGCGPKGLLYRTANGAEYFSLDRQAQLSTALRHKVPVMGTIDADLEPELLNERLADVSRQTIARLVEMRRYRPECYITRIEADTTLQAFIDGKDRLMIVEGPVGAGKTSWLCATAEARLCEGRIVLLTLTDRLASFTFPDALGSPTRVRGDLNGAMNRLGSLSGDGRVLVLIDDLGVGGNEAEAITSLFSWIDGQSVESPVQVVATLRTDRIQAFLEQHESPWPSGTRRIRMSSLSTAELLDLATRLPLPDSAVLTTIAEGRREVASRLASLGDESARRPGLATAILESVTTESLPSTFSPVAVYEAILNRDILENSDDGRPRTPLRAGLVSRLAWLQLDRGETSLSLDTPDVAQIGLLNPTSGQRSTDYSALLASRILTEIMEDFLPHVMFVDPSFTEFMAALRFPLSQTKQVLHSLLDRSRARPAFLSIAAFFLSRAVRSSRQVKGNLSENLCSLMCDLQPARLALLQQLAIIDGASFLKIFRALCAAEWQELLDVVTWLCDTGEARLASRAATILKETAATPEQQKDARYLNARALYELDQYKPAEEELAMVSEKDCSIYALWGDIAASRADYPVALENYRAAVNAPGINQALRAHSVRGLGYVLGRLGKVQEAEECLRESINLLTGSEAKRTLAEAWGDLGQLLCNLRRIEDSRDSLERSLALNQELGNLPGIGIVYGLLGELEMVQGHLNEAASHFRESQEIAFRTANRWRQAWVLKRLSQLSAALGDQKEADALLSASREIFNKIGSKGD